MHFKFSVFFIVFSLSFFNINILVIVASQDQTLNFSDCTVALERSNKSGVYQIKIPQSELAAFDVYCLRNDTNEMANTDANADTTTDSYTNWLLIQRRMDGSVDFNRNWADYQEGFGNLDGEFFIGLKKLHELTKSRLHELWIQLENFDGEKRWAKYSNFSVGNETEAYELKSLGNYTGDAGDSLSYHINQKWTTRDVDNDKNDDKNCADSYRGAWWHNHCLESNLNGLYLAGAYSMEWWGKGIMWHAWNGYLYSHKYVHMAIRPID